MLIFGYTRLLAIILATWTTFSMGAQETIIFRLNMRNLCYDAYFPFLIF